MTKIIKFITITICSLIIFQPVTGTSATRQFPTFEEMKRCFRNEDNCEKYADVTEYSDFEIDTALNTGNPAYIFSIGVDQLTFEDYEILLTLSQKSVIEFKALALNSLIVHALNEYRNEPNAESGLSKEFNLEQLIISYKNADPQNSLPCYLESYYYFKNNNQKKAIESLKQAESRPNFKLYSKEIFNYSASTTKFLGYPEFLSMDKALTTTLDAVYPMLYWKLGKYICAVENANGFTPNNSMAILGNRLHDNSMMAITKIIGIRILEVANQGNTEKACELAKERKAILALTDGAKEEYSTISEKQVLRIYQNMLEVDEVYAMKNLKELTEQQAKQDTGTDP